MPKIPFKKTKAGMKTKKKKKTIEGIEGRSFCITGTLSSMKRKEAQAAVINAGGIVRSGVSKTLEVLVTGANPGSKVALAEAYGVEIWDEDTFIEALAKEEEEEEEEEEVKKHVKKKKKSSPACSGPRWEWEDDDGNWNQYAKEDGELIEGSYQTEEPSFVTKDFSWNLKHQTLYKVDFENMIQINVESEVERNIRRLGP
eukprot:CAMPEP_0114515746 /NCGR_PEP_ID=MMETSP0109-20121206/16923_1 /TAXON_ID=29199 /ORGANISM="Chlorarachnion reptans, Strain CCCM449" /LENGTH=199 /DNA_ID=CAMNT_0001696017 /DNA_START=36 /DNA_END=631 /DNA_ORIENTATION=+